LRAPRARRRKSGASFAQVSRKFARRHGAIDLYAFAKRDARRVRASFCASYEFRKGVGTRVDEHGHVHEAPPGAPGRPPEGQIAIGSTIKDALCRSGAIRFTRILEALRFVRHVRLTRVTRKVPRGPDLPPQARTARHELCLTRTKIPSRFAKPQETV
jgi:hypothetical protein